MDMGINIPFSIKNTHSCTDKGKLISLSSCACALEVLLCILNGSFILENTSVSSLWLFHSFCKQLGSLFLAENFCCA